MFLKATEQTCLLKIKLSVVIFKLKWTLWQFFFSFLNLQTGSFSYIRIKALWTVSFAWDLGILRLTWEIHIFYEKIIFFVWWKFIFAGHYCTSFCKFHYDGLQQAVFIKKWLIFWSKQLNCTEKEEQSRNLIPTIRTACLSLHLRFVS